MCAVGAADGDERRLSRRPAGPVRRDLGRWRGLPSPCRSVLRGGAPMRNWAGLSVCRLPCPAYGVDDRRVPRQYGEAAVQRKPDAPTCRARLCSSASSEASAQVRLLFAVQDGPIMGSICYVRRCTLLHTKMRGWELRRRPL